jgi:hypothetical protein
MFYLIVGCTVSNQEAALINLMQQQLRHCHFSGVKKQVAVASSSMFLLFCVGAVVLHQE